jgi:hypothetical protein
MIRTIKLNRSRWLIIEAECPCGTHAAWLTLINAECPCGAMLHRSGAGAAPRQREETPELVAEPL